MFQGKDDISHFAAFQSKKLWREVEPGAYKLALAYISSIERRKFQLVKRGFNFPAK